MSADPVSFSARVIAGKIFFQLAPAVPPAAAFLNSCSASVAYRAIESQEEVAIFHDPMAEAMAGPTAIKQVSLYLDMCLLHSY